MDWIYLSPHLDDVTLSVGGLVWEQTAAGEKVGIWTICGGDPPPGDLSPFAAAIHQRWGVGPEAIGARRTEDIESCRVLGAEYLHFNLPDCIYRRSPQTREHLYATEEALWIPVHLDEEVVIQQLSFQLRTKLPPGAKLVCPLTIGDHVDHRLTRAAAEQAGLPLYYYADYPYAANLDFSESVADFQTTRFPISSAGLSAWQLAIAAHRSQISTFWGNLKEMEAAILSYCKHMDGFWLWKSE
jgi:LmbE family N-acetylglucosaminyl deacetylase